MNDDARGIPLPLAVALLPGNVTAAIVAQLCAISTVEAKRSIDVWLRIGVLSTSQLHGEAPRVRPATRDAALALTSTRQRRRAFEEIARTLDEPDAPESELLQIARCYRAAAAYRLSIARFLTVAEARLDRGEREAASVVLAEAAATTDGRRPELLAVLDLQAQCAVAAGDLPFALAILERLRRLAATCGDRYATIRALLRCADCHLLSEAFEQAIDFASRAVELCGSMSGCAHESVSGRLMLAEALVALGRQDEAAGHMEEARLLDADRNGAGIARYHYVTGLLQLATDPLAAGTAFRAAATAATIELDYVQALQAARALALAHVANADLFSAISTLRAALTTAHTQRLPVLVKQLTRDLASAQFEAGRLAEALRVIAPEGATGSTPILLRIALARNDCELIERWTTSAWLDDALASRCPKRIAAVIPCYAEIERRNSAHSGAQALYRRALKTLAGLPVPAEFLCDAAEHCAPEECAAVRSLLGRAKVNAQPLATLIVELGELVLELRCEVDPVDIAARATAIEAALLCAGFKMLAARARALAVRAVPAGRDQSVICLIAAGRSNAEIASELHLSKRTVEKTIGTLLKLHRVRSRWQLTGGRANQSAAKAVRSGPASYFTPDERTADNVQSLGSGAGPTFCGCGRSCKCTNVGDSRARSRADQR